MWLVDLRADTQIYQENFGAWAVCFYTGLNTLLQDLQFVEFGIDLAFFFNL